MMIPAPLTIALLALLALSGCATGSPAPTEIPEEAIETEGRRALLAHHLARVEVEASADIGAAREHLRFAWFLGRGVFDDRLVRKAVAAHPTLGTGAMARVLNAERGHAAYSEGNHEKARGFFTNATSATLDLTEARRRLVLALMDTSANPASARIALIQLANAALPSPAGLEIRSLARTTAASIDYDNGRMADAIKAFQRVSEESAYWNMSRTAVAWSLYGMGKFERALGLLKLLPGGLSGDPERALLAAVCLHQGGKSQAAQGVVDRALAGQGAWLTPSVDPNDVLQAIASESWGLPLLGAITTHAPLRLLGREILATDEALKMRSSAYQGDLQAYRKSAFALFREFTRRKAAEHRKRAKMTFEKLNVLRPQLVTPEP